LAKKIRIVSESVAEITAELDEERNPKTCTAIWEALPFEAKASIWGDEIYFSIPVKLGEENAQETVKAGDLGYWPPGKGFCIFFGPTPISRGEEIRPADPVNIFGRVLGDPKVFRNIKGGERIRVERLE
jgi:hypothetical protein